MHTSARFSGGAIIDVDRTDPMPHDPETCEIDLMEGRAEVLLELSPDLGERLLEELAEEYGASLVRDSNYWEKCVAALEEEQSKWGRAELLLERACEELVGRGASSTAERCAAAAINATLGLVAEQFHPMHKREVEARQEDR